jgi:hypothetical protein
MVIAPKPQKLKLLRNKKESTWAPPMQPAAALMTNSRTCWPRMLLLLLLLLQGMDGSGGWGNFSGVAADSSGWVTQLWENMKAGTMMIRWAGNTTHVTLLLFVLFSCYFYLVCFLVG